MGTRDCPDCTEKVNIGDSRCPCGHNFSVNIPHGIGECVDVVMQDLIRKSRMEGQFDEAVRGVGSIVYERNNVDFNDYKPIQVFPFDERPVNIVTINHELAKNIIGVQFEHRVAIYQLDIQKDAGEEFFTLKKLQELTTVYTSQQLKLPKVISCFSVNSASNVSQFGDRNLTYAFSYEGESKFYLSAEYTCGPFSSLKELDSETIGLIDGHKGTVSHLAFDAERGELLASLSDDAVCVIWAVAFQQQVSRLSLHSPGVACLWHKSEPYKLLIIEQGGLIRMYNALKQCVIITINTLVQPIYCADWSQVDSQLVGLGANKCAYIFDLSLLNSEPGKRIETHFGATHCIKFSSIDSQQLSTATIAPRGEIKTFQRNFRKFVWTQKHESVQSIAWVYGEPFLMALIAKQLCIYESLLV